MPYVASPGSKEKMSKRKIDKYRTNPQFQKFFELGDQVLSRIGVDPKSNDLVTGDGGVLSSKSVSCLQVY
jgi:hypothetical protein